MIICVCSAVRERQIRELVEQHGRGVRMRDLRERLGVCGACGKCARRAQGILRDCSGCDAGAAGCDAGSAAVPVPATPGAVPVTVVAEPRPR